MIGTEDMAMNIGQLQINEFVLVVELAQEEPLPNWAFLFYSK